MRQRWRKTAIFGLALIMITSALYGCQISVTEAQTNESGQAGTEPGDVQQDISVLSQAELSFTANDLEFGYDETEAVRITLSDGGIEISGPGAAEEDGVLTISQAGTYLISGTLSDGQIVVNAGSQDKIRLIFENVTVHCSEHAPLYIKTADKVFLTLAEGSENVLTDGSAYVLGTDDDTVDGVIFSKADLTVNGTDSLRIEASYKHGVVSKDDLVVTGGILEITANGNALSGKDCVKIADGTFVLNAKTDAIQSDNVEDSALGYVYIRGGSFQIVTESDAIQAETLLCIEGGEFDILTGGGSANAEAKIVSGWNPWDTAAETTDNTSIKGLKAGSGLVISGGTYVIDSADDCIHSNGSVSISGGNFTLATGDDGVHADAALTLSGGVLHITESFEGLEGKSVTITGGEIDIVSSDDGINAAGGSDEADMKRSRPQDAFSADADAFISIEDGTLLIDASGDGIDSNGNLTISGGTVLISGPIVNDDSAFDCQGSVAVNGGTVVAAGSAGMAQTFSEDSAQCSLCYVWDTTLSAESTVALYDADGDELVSFAPAKSYQCVVISVPTMYEGHTYTISAGGNVYEMTLTSVATSNGNTFGEGFPMGGMNGGRPGNFGGDMPENMTPPEGFNGNPPENSGAETIPPDDTDATA